MGLKLVKRVIIRGMMHVYSNAWQKFYSKYATCTFKGKCSVSGQVKYVYMNDNRFKEREILPNITLRIVTLPNISPYPS